LVTTVSFSDAGGGVAFQARRPKSTTGRSRESVSTVATSAVTVAPSSSLPPEGGAAVVNEKVRSAASESGGSMVSTSATPLAETVTVHASPAPKGAVGVIVKVVGPPETMTTWAPLVSHEIETAPLASVTGSSNPIVTTASVATPVAPSAGDVDTTDGALSDVQDCDAVAELRGEGAPATKSAAFESLSVQPPSARSAAAALPSTGAGPDPS
jgi:hypothetical protein